MKERLLSFLLPVLLLLLILFAPIASSGAASGLILWYRQVLPVLMPFTLIVQFMMSGDTILRFSRWMGPLIHRLLGLSPVCSFCILTGFLCGFPMGAVTASQALEQNLITKKEAQILAGTCNNAGPMFVSSYILESRLNAGPQRPVLTLIFYGAPLLWLCIRSRLLTRQNSHDPRFIRRSVGQPDHNNHPKTSARQILLNSSELMLKVGVFMMLFAILCELLANFPILPKQLSAIMAMLFEITNGAAAIISLTFSTQIKTVLIMSGTAFGGLCIAAQTYAVIHSQKLSFIQYLLDKLVIALLTGLLTFIRFY